jgi:hypothetical protein
LSRGRHSSRIDKGGDGHFILISLGIMPNAESGAPAEYSLMTEFLNSSFSQYAVTGKLTNP